MRKIFMVSLLLLTTIGFAQTDAEKASLVKSYQEMDDADTKVKELLLQEKSENKNIILQIGGNWCIWCLYLNDFIQKTDEFKSIVDKNYIYYHLNWSPKNKNEKFFTKYGNPDEKQGYPIFMVLDKVGKLIHIQETGSLEEGKGYSQEKVKAFFDTWIAKS